MIGYRQKVIHFQTNWSFELVVVGELLVVLPLRFRGRLSLAQLVDQSDQRQLVPAGESPWRNAL